MPEIPFIGGAYESRSPNVDAQRCVNLYPVLDKEGGKPISLSPTPGLKVWANVSKSYENRAGCAHNEYLYAVIGNTVYRFDVSGNYVELANKIGTSSGQVFMAANANGEIGIVDVDGGVGYYVSGLVVGNMGLPFSNPGKITFQDGYGIIGELNSNRFWISGLNAFSTWSALDYGSAESQADYIVACISDHQELWVFGNKTAEPYRNTGNTYFPFERITSVIQEVGLGSAESLVQLDNSMFFLDNFGNIRRIEGYTPVVVSSPQVGYRISTYGDISNAKGMGYVHEGQAFYLLTFPNANSGNGITECLDVSTGLWHQRSSYPRTDGKSRWRGNWHAFFDGKNLFGDYEQGIVYELDHTLYTDNDEILPAIRRGQTIEAGRKTMFLHNFELHIQSGVGIATGQGDDPQIMLRRSKDGGHTWGNEKWKSMGKIGEYTRRVRWGELGSARSWTPEVTITDPVNRVLIGAYLDYTIGTH